jgi:hypothetical protein
LQGIPNWTICGLTPGLAPVASEQGWRNEMVGLVEVLEQIAVDRAELGQVTCWLGRAVHELDQPGERQAALGVIEGLLGSRTCQVAEDPCLWIEVGVGELLAIRHRNSPACGSGQPIAGACPRYEFVGVDAARDVLVGVGEGIGVDVQAFHLVAVDGVLHAPLALSAFSLGNDLLVRHGKPLSLLHSTRQGLRVQWYRNHRVVPVSG